MPQGGIARKKLTNHGIHGIHRNEVNDDLSVLFPCVLCVPWFVFLSSLARKRVTNHGMHGIHRNEVK